MAGPDIEGRVFIYDTETGKLKMFQSPSLDDENAGIEAWADIRSVTNDGVGYGDVDAKSAKFDFATGKYNYLLDESVEDYSLVHYATADGKFNCGVTYNDAYIQHPYVMKDGKDELSARVNRRVDWIRDKWLYSQWRQQGWFGYYG